MHERQSRMCCGVASLKVPPLEPGDRGGSVEEREESMEEKDIQQPFHLLHQEIEAAVSLIEDTKLDNAAAIDDLKIEVEVLRRFMERYHPDFASRYAELRAEVIQEVNPEWTEPGRRAGT